MPTADFESTVFIRQVLYATVIGQDQRDPVEEHDELPARQQPANERGSGYQAANQDVSQPAWYQVDDTSPWEKCLFPGTSQITRATEREPMR